MTKNKAKKYTKENEMQDKHNCRKTAYSKLLFYFILFLNKNMLEKLHVKEV